MQGHIAAQASSRETVLHEKHPAGKHSPVSFGTMRHTALSVALTIILAVQPLALAAPPNVNLVWTDNPPTPYAPVTLVPGQSLVLNWPGAVRITPSRSPAIASDCAAACCHSSRPLTQCCSRAGAHGLDGEPHLPLSPCTYISQTAYHAATMV